MGATPACPAASPGLFCYVRFGGTFSYPGIPTVPGRLYRVRVTLTEVYWSAAGARSFNWLVNGVVRLAGIDPYALAVQQSGGSGKFVPVLREVDVAATTTSMTVSFTTTLDNALVAAVEVREAVLRRNACSVGKCWCTCTADVHAHVCIPTVL